MQKFALIALLLGVVLLLGCTGGTQNAATPTPAATLQVVATPAATQTTVTQSPTVGIGATATATLQATTGETATPSSTGSMEAQVIQMVAKQWEFVPATLTVKKGVPVKLVIQNPDVAHGLAIPDLGVNQNLPAGETTTVEFTPDKAGTFTFFCNVFCGEGHRGMKGTITVTG